MFRKIFKNVKGATAIEYGLIAALIAIGIVATVTSVGNALDNTFNTVSTELEAANS
ncbi:MAG TPA: Flp family type IVb pilin [Allosphingosinicella sp.]|uniref:Flp family type IVb pilin n=1 Tax=Allosphingosinicella sp. TaxID=2823234 RepID=UPI002ED83210